MPLVNIPGDDRSRDRRQDLDHDRDLARIRRRVEVFVGHAEAQQALADAGAFAIVLELVEPSLAREISQAIAIPTIGIGSGQDCDGQILVTHDLVGMFPWFTPRFIKPKVQNAAQMKSAVAQWMADMRKDGP